MSEARYLMQWHAEIRGRCGSSGMGGIEPITWPDIACWSHLTAKHPDPYEVRVICAIDDVFLKVMRAPDDPDEKNGEDE